MEGVSQVRLGCKQARKWVRRGDLWRRGIGVGSGVDSSGQTVSLNCLLRILSLPVTSITGSLENRCSRLHMRSRPPSVHYTLLFVGLESPTLGSSASSSLLAGCSLTHGCPAAVCTSVRTHTPNLAIKMDPGGDHPALFRVPSFQSLAYLQVQWAVIVQSLLLLPSSSAMATLKLSSPCLPCTVELIFFSSWRAY